MTDQPSPVRIVNRPPDGVLEDLDQALFDAPSAGQATRQCTSARSPPAELAALDPEHLRYWLHVNATYMLPSLELIAWLKEQIGGRKAIEIASGNGVLGRALGIPMTDSRLQERPEVRMQMALMGQPPVRYGDDVEQRNANAAVRVMKPEVTVGSWCTHLCREDDHERKGSMYGVDEQKIVAACDYIHIGSKAVHDKKRIMDLPHEEHELPGLIFGRGEPQDRRVWIWRKQ